MNNNKIIFNIIKFNSLFFLSTLWIFNYKTPIIPAGFILTLIYIIVRKKISKIIFIDILGGLIIGFFLLGFHLSYQYPIIRFGFRLGEISTVGDEVLNRLDTINNIKEKLSTLNYAYNKDKKNIDVKLEYAWYLTILENYDKALNIYNESIIIAPESMKENIEKKIIIVKNLIENNAFAYYDFGRSLITNNEEIEYIIYFFEKCLKLNQIKEDNLLSALYFDLGFFNNEIKEYEKSLYYFKKTLEIIPNDEEVLNFISKLEDIIK